MPFAYVKDGATKLSDISANTSTTSTVIGEIKWKSETRAVLRGHKKDLGAKFRDALINDSTITFLLSVLGDLISKIISSKTHKKPSVTLGNYNGCKLSTKSRTEITEVKDLVNLDATLIRNIFAKNVELSNAVIVRMKITSFYTYISVVTKEKV